MLDRKEPFKKFRVATDLIDEIQAMKKREGDRAPLNNYVETLLSRATDQGGAMARMEKKMDLLLELLSRLIPEAAPNQPRVLVRGHRPAKESDEHQRKTG